MARAMIVEAGGTRGRGALLAVAIALGAAGEAAAARIPVHRLPPPATSLAEGKPTVAPLDFVHFCMRLPAECAADGAGGPIALDARSFAEIEAVNRAVNRSIRAERGPRGVLGSWDVAPEAGDCNDYAVTKRHELIRRGYPAGALLLAVVRTSWGEGHLVLTIRTDRGDYVLDNLDAAVRPWSAARHRWIKRQSSRDPRAWVSLDGADAALDRRGDGRRAGLSVD